MAWWGYAILSAMAAAATAILAKLGVKDVPSNLATALRTTVVVLFAWAIVLATGEARELHKVPTRSSLFLVLSGVATGISWLAYFRALELGRASRVAPLDKLSLPLTVFLAVVILHEPLTLRLGIGVTLVLVGIVVASS